MTSRSKDPKPGIITRGNFPPFRVFNAVLRDGKTYHFEKVGWSGYYITCESNWRLERWEIKSTVELDEWLEETQRDNNQDEVSWHEYPVQETSVEEEEFETSKEDDVPL